MAVQKKWYVCIYQPLHISRMRHKVNLKQSLTVLNSEFSFSKTGCRTDAKEPSLPNYYYGGRIAGFIPLPPCEMQTCNVIERLIENWNWINKSSSSCRAACTDIPDPLSPRLPIIHRLRQVFGVTSRIIT